MIYNIICLRAKKGPDGMRKAGTGMSIPLSPAHTYTYPLNKVVVDFTATAKSLQSFMTLCDPIPGILQARTLEWVAISFSNA